MDTVVATNKTNHQEEPRSENNRDTAWNKSQTTTPVKIDHHNSTTLTSARARSARSCTKEHPLMKNQEE